MTTRIPSWWSRSCAISSSSPATTPRRGETEIDPDVIAATGVPATTADEEDDASDAPDPTGQAFMRALRERGWRFSNDQVQFRNTILIDLAQSEDDLLAAMSQSTRRKIRIAQREGVTVRGGSIADLPLLYDLYRVTGRRDEFLIRPPDYYEQAWQASSKPDSPTR
ncbi:MAG: peptidoglycan bridge formation glycyltransferase FemA/FemB family protein [Anaerolineae bacterium]